MTLRIELPLATFFIPADYGLNIMCNYMGGLEPCVSIRGKNIEVDIYLSSTSIDDYDKHRSEYKNKLSCVKDLISHAICEILNSKEDKTLTVDDFKNVKLSWKYFDV
jgi:hypothetical protein